MNIMAEYLDITLDSKFFQDKKKLVDQKVGEKREKEYRLKTIKEKKKQLEDNIINYQKAIEIIKKVTKETQEKISFHISNLVTMAESAVFEDSYTFEMEFVDRRGKTECDLWFIKDGVKMKPIESGAGGELDVASFALRCAFWSLNKKRPVMILDEPFRFVSVDLQNKCSEMLKEISKRLGIQIIMVSHLPNIISCADKIFRVEKKAGISIVKEE